MDSAVPPDTSPLPLRPDETLIWQGRIGFTAASSTFTMFVLVVITCLVIWAVWGSYSLAEFCPANGRVSRCGAFYVTLPLGMIIIVLAQGFDWLERRAVESGRALGAVILTDRRLIRLSDWPWHRVQAYDYRARPPRRGAAGVLQFGGYRSVALSPADANRVLQMMTTAEDTSS